MILETYVRPLGVWAIGMVGMTAPAWSADITVAVAANFAQPFQRIADAFGKETGHRVILSTGSTGKFYTQIKQGAPFEVLLAADDETPKKLEQEGLAVKGQRFTYARGKLVLWSAQAGLVDPEGAVLKRAEFAHLAMANPKLAPYGAAAHEALKALGLYDRLQSKLVVGDNITQTHQFIASGNAELGFVAWSQVIPVEQPARGSWWVVPSNLYNPILQDAALLLKGADNPAAHGLLKFLKSDKAKAIIKSYGYEL